jgi:MFS family permease
VAHDARVNTTSGSVSAERQALPWGHLVTLSIYWLGINTIWAGFNTIVLPTRLLEIAPEQYGLLTAITFAVGVIAPILIQPTVGVISDYTITRWGRRKPYILIGTVLDLVFLIALASAQSYLAIVVLYFMLQLSSNFAQGPFQGYVPDLVPERQVGTASGLMGAMIVVGQIVGVGIATVGVSLDSLGLATVALGLTEMVTMIVLVLTVREGSAGPRRTTSWLAVARSAWGTDILREKSVLWLLAVRALFLGAFAIITLALDYFVGVHGMTHDEASGTILLGTIIVGVATALAAVPGGRLSDRVGRKPMIYGAAAVAAVGVAGVALAPAPWVAIVSYIPFGIGVGVFLSVDWALMTDVIPKHTSGRYMGILNAGTAVAAPLFLVVAGPTRDIVNGLAGSDVGPRAAMGVAIVYLLLAAVALSRVDPHRREAPAELAPPAVDPAATAA